MVLHLGGGMELPAAAASLDRSLDGSTSLLAHLPADVRVCGARVLVDLTEDGSDKLPLSWDHCLPVP